MFTKKENVTPLAIAQPKPVVTQRNTASLRSVLFDELDSFLLGKTTPERVRSVTTIANSIIDSARLELEFARYVKTRGAAGKKMAVTPVKLARKVA